jgi:hypothetical protein
MTPIFILHIVDKMTELKAWNLSMETEMKDQKEKQAKPLR